MDELSEDPSSVSLVRLGWNVDDRGLLRDLRLGAIKKINVTIETICRLNTGCSKEYKAFRRMKSTGKQTHHYELTWIDRKDQLWCPI